MKIGIVGSGNLGRSLGVLWDEHGHDVFFGSRERARAEAAAAYARSGAAFGTNDEAAAFGEVVLWGAGSAPVDEVLSDPGLLADKVVIDPSNGPLREDMRLGPGEDGPSLAERLAAALPGAKIVKAFNTLPIEVHEHSPSPLRDFSVSTFLAGDDGQAKQTVARLAEKIGYVPVDCGPLKSARMLEGLADFVRYMGATMGHGPFAALSLYDLPPARGQRLGGRQTSGTSGPS